MPSAERRAFIRRATPVRAPDDAANNAKLLRRAGGYAARSSACARYRCALVFVESAEDAAPLIAEGSGRDSFSMRRAARAASATTRISGCRILG